MEYQTVVSDGARAAEMGTSDHERERCYSPMAIQYMLAHTSSEPYDSKATSGEPEHTRVHACAEDARDAEIERLLDIGPSTEETADHCAAVEVEEKQLDRVKDAMRGKEPLAEVLTSLVLGNQRDDSDTFDEHIASRSAQTRRAEQIARDPLGALATMATALAFQPTIQYVRDLGLCLEGIPEPSKHAAQSIASSSVVHGAVVRDRPEAGSNPAKTGHSAATVQNTVTSGAAAASTTTVGGSSPINTSAITSKSTVKLANPSARRARNRARSCTHSTMGIFEPVLYFNRPGLVCCGHLCSYQPGGDNVFITPPFYQRSVRVPAHRVIAKVFDGALPETPPIYIKHYQVKGRSKTATERRHKQYTGLNSQVGVVVARKWSARGTDDEMEALLRHALRGASDPLALEPDVRTSKWVTLEGSLESMKKQLAFHHEEQTLFPESDFFVTANTQTGDAGAHELRGQRVVVCEVRPGNQTARIVHRLAARGWIATSIARTPHKVIRSKIHEIRWSTDDNALAKATECVHKELLCFRDDMESFVEQHNAINGSASFVSGSLHFTRRSHDAETKTKRDGDYRDGATATLAQGGEGAGDTLTGHKEDDVTQRFTERNRLPHHIPEILGSDPPGCAHWFTSGNTPTETRWMPFAAHVLVSMLFHASNTLHLPMDDHNVIKNVEEHCRLLSQPLGSYLRLCLFVYESNATVPLDSEFVVPSVSNVETKLSYNTSQKLSASQASYLMDVQYWGWVHMDPATMPIKDHCGEPMSTEFHRRIFAQVINAYTRFSQFPTFPREYRTKKQECTRSIHAAFIDVVAHGRAPAASFRNRKHTGTSLRTALVHQTTAAPVPMST